MVAGGIGGSNRITSQNGGGAGGGGGYYGGSGSSGLNEGSWSGGGGSSFISGHNGCNAINENGTHRGNATHFSGRVFTNTVMIDGLGRGWTHVVGGNVAMPRPSGGNYASGQGHAGNGYARITRIS